MKKYLIRGWAACWMSALQLVTACDPKDAPAPATTWVRVFDLRFNNPSQPQADVPLYLSAFTWDGHYYGNAELDTVTVPPKQPLANFGDFSLGRSITVADDWLLTEEAYDYRGPIDYVGPSQKLNVQPYQQSDEGANRAVSFPNLSHRVPVGSIINDIDYYKWAVFPAGLHDVGFSPILKAKRGSWQFQYAFDSTRFSNRYWYFQPNGIYSLFLVRTTTDERQANQATLVRLREDAEMRFDPTRAYVRFVNTIPLTGQAAADVLTESIDMYMRQVDSREVQQLAKTATGFDIRFLKNTTAEKLVATNLKRFQPDDKVPFIALDYTSFLSREDTSWIAAAQVPTYVFYAYPHGDSQATQAAPLKNFTCFVSNTDLLGSSAIYPLVRTSTGFVPTISTVLLGTDAGAGGLYYNLEQAAVRKAFLDQVTRDK